jgi:hypothetical protein
MRNAGIFMVLVLFLGLFVSCTGELFQSEEERSNFVTFTMRNKSDENGNTGEEVHMWITEESIGPDNKVLVGERRETDYVLINTENSGNPDYLTEFEDETFMQVEMELLLIP